MRVLGRVRLSRYREENTSVERQREIIERWATENGHEIVAWAEDVEVSGSLSPFDTPALGPYLAKPLMNDWDIICSWKLDRIARNSLELHKVFAWVQDNGKQLVCVSDNIDLSSWVGRMIASVIAGLAEGELEAITERITAAKAKQREIGRWTGGHPLFGYQKSKLEAGGWKLELNPEEQPILQRIISDFLDGKTTEAIARELTQEGIPSPQALRWGADTRGWRASHLRDVLSSRSLLGWTTHNKRTYLDKEGKPVLLGPPSVTPEVFQEIQELLSASSFSKRNPDKTSDLFNVLECWYCGRAMHVRRSTLRSGLLHIGYHCPDKCTKQPAINGDVLLPMVYEAFEQELGGYNVMQKVTSSASDVTVDLAEAKAAYDDIADYLTTASAATRKTLFSQLDILSTRIEELENAPTEDETIWVDTGESYLSVWEGLDIEGKRKLMERSGIRVRARALSRGTRHAPGIIEMEFIVPDDLKTKLA